MHDSTIYIFGDTNAGVFPLQLGKNYAIDDLERFLSDYQLTSALSFQYVKHGLEITIKLDLSESYQAPANLTDIIKYVSIMNDNEAPLYYYATKTEVLSPNCVRLLLRLDTINTLLTANTPRRLEFTEKTKVIREHSNRYYLPTGSISNLYQRRIPLLSEGITPILYKTKERLLNQLEEGDFGTWYLIYKTDYTQEQAQGGQPNPVKTYLLNDSPIVYETASGSPLLFNYDNTTAESNRRLAFTRLEGNTGRVDIYTNADGTGSAYRSFTSWDSLVFYRERVTISAGQYDYLIRVYVNGEFIAGQTRAIKLSPTFTYGAYITNTTATNVYELSYLINESSAQYPINTSVGRSTIAFNILDRTDARLVKIIALPYCPIKYNIVSGVFTPVGVSVNYVDNMLLLPNNIDFDVDLSKNVSGESGTYADGFISFRPRAGQSRRHDESKLFHSDYFYQKYVYDSFNYTIKLENIFNQDQGADGQNYATKTYLHYYVSNAIKSAFMFDVKAPFTALESEDYDFILYVNRNNEIALFDSQYINYLRTGYNYDVKNKNRQEATTWISTALGVASSVAGVVTGNVGLTAVGVTSTLASLTSAISNTIANETNLQAKINQLQNQKASIVNADDFNLLKHYSSNKVKIETWSASDQVRGLLENLFYYTGYLVNEYKKPTHDNRIYFDFLACEPYFESLYNWDSVIITDLTEKLNEGVTFIHRYNNTYNTALDLENWERDIIE